MTADRPRTVPAEPSAIVENAIRICRAHPSSAFLVVGERREVVRNAALDSGLAAVPSAALADLVGTVFAAGGGVDGVPVVLGGPPDQPAAAAFVAVPLYEAERVAAVLAVAAPEAPADTLRREVERAVAAKSRFLASASHDLRQPFQAMRLFQESLVAQLDGHGARETATMLGTALEAGEKLLNALLDISTLDAGTVTPVTRPFALHEMLERLAAEIRPQAQEKGLRVRIRLRPAIVDSDPILMERIVRNLLSNAVRYTRRGGILLGTRRRGDRVSVEVWDTGFGIPPDQLDAIFDEFHQLENPGRDPGRGLGLGLAIVRRLSALLQTSVCVRSAVGRGTLFAVSVPAGAATPDVAPDAAGIAEAATVVLEGTTVLVVEDDPMVLTGLRICLESWGCVVLGAGDMREVFATLDSRTEPPDIILSDLRLSAGLSGFDVIDRVRRLYGRAIPSIVLTGETGEAELQEGRRRGCAFLHKPLHPADLRRVIGRLACVVRVG